MTISCTRRAPRWGAASIGPLTRRSRGSTVHIPGPVTRCASIGRLPHEDMTDTGPPASAEDRREQRDASAAPLRAVAEAVQDAIISADRDGLITKWLAGAEQLFGWRRAEMLGRPLVTIIPDELRERHRTAFERAVAGQTVGIIGGGPVRVDALREDGTTFP